MATTARGAGTTAPAQSSGGKTDQATAAATTTTTTTPSRKRRRRPPTTGAADDCFTCRDRGVSCDRRRPYCSQCLEMKMTCSGYKTQLTWGVGVASRGKLRGLSLPVAKGKNAPASPSSPPAEKKTTATAKKPSSSSSSSAATSTPTSGKPKQPRTPSSAGGGGGGITPQPQQQPTPAPSSHGVPVSYAFVGVGADAPTQQQQQQQHQHQHQQQPHQQQSAPPFQTNFEWPPQPKYASSDVRHQPLHGDVRDDDDIYERPLKRRALHVDTTDLASYPRQNAYPVSAAPVLNRAEYNNRPYNSPVSPYQPQSFEHGHVRHSSFSAHGSHPFQFTDQRNLQQHHPHHQTQHQHQHQQPQQQQYHHHHHHHQQHSVGSPNHWSTGYPSPTTASDHGSYVSVSTPDHRHHHHHQQQHHAFPSGGLSDPTIGLAADQLLAMQQPQHHHFLPHTSITSFGGAGVMHEVDEEDVEDIGRGDTDSIASGWDLVRINQTFASQEKVGNTPELRYLINYYLEVLTPVIIAFDGPGNPWREHVLSLARHNEGLQHAIAALSATNIRMRREHKNDRPRLPPTEDSVHDIAVRRSSEAHERLNDEVEPPQLSKPGAPSKRETFHKTQAIAALNKQLGDPAGRSDDSILAILLVICLYHMCETGVARFKTQFAGVKKIMAMREARKAPTKEVNWMITFFKWFDAMAATVNDRESQFSATRIFPLDEDGSDGGGDEDWGLENLAGCDSQLFTIVNKLGRLNVLSQGKDPSLSPAGSGMTPPPFFSPIAGPHGPHLHPDLVFDGSGWAQMSPVSAASGMSPHTGSPGGGTDPRSQQFWAEWSRVRNELQSWRFDPAYLPAPMRTAAAQQLLRHGSTSSAVSVSSNASSGLQQQQQQQQPPYNLAPHQQFADASIADISNISESFRHAALLYTERLAWPALPPEHPQLQTIVVNALHYIRLVKSDVCLLWPLFIVGAECVREEQRSIVRTRVWDIQNDSGFFNNIKCLELLEVIWDKADRSRQANGGAWHVGHHADPDVFKWRKEMKNADGEYIVI